MLYGVGGSDWQLLDHASIQTKVIDKVQCLAFDSTYESVWGGTGGGYVVCMQAPQLQRYISYRAHQPALRGTQQDGGTLGLLSVQGALVSAGLGSVACHHTQGLPLWSHRESQTTFSAVAVDPTTSQQVLAARSKWASPVGGPSGAPTGALLALDLPSGTPVHLSGSSTASVCQVQQPVTHLVTGEARGYVLCGTASGQVLLCDPRAGYTVENTVVAHPSGLSSLEAKGDLVVTAGYSARARRKVVDAYARVYDVRAGARLMTTLPFQAGGPSFLRFHPAFSSTLFVASQTGMFGLLDVNGTMISVPQPVTDPPAQLSAMALAPTGSCVALGGERGDVFVLARASQPSGVHLYQQALPSLPTRYTPPSISLDESDPPVMVPTYSAPAGSDKLLSAIESGAVMAVGMAPRLLDKSIAIKQQDDWVGVAPNPSYSPGQSKQQVVPAVQALRNRRVPPPGGRQAGAQKMKKRRSMGGAPPGALPGRYARMEAKTTVSARPFDAFNYTAFNRSRFSGLENDLPNCYINSLLQVLFYIPAIRAAVLHHFAQPKLEFSLLCELAFLFRMFVNASGGTCRASNFLRALRQDASAAQMSLLEGKGVTNTRQLETGVTDAELTKSKEVRLGCRMQRLTQHLVQRLHKEALSAGEPSAFAYTFKHTYETKLQLMQGSAAMKPPTETEVLQLNLQFPEASTRPKPSAVGGPPSPYPCRDPLPATGRPSFAALLERSLSQSQDLHMQWEGRGRLQAVKKTRVPVSLPVTMLIGCYPERPEDLVHFSPYPASDSGKGAGTPTPWFPPAVCVEITRTSCEEGQQPASTSAGITVKVQEASSVEQLLQAAASQQTAKGGQSSGIRRVYQLTALVCHVWDEFVNGPPQGAQQEAPEAPEGHMVAHIKVPSEYVLARRSTSFSHSLSCAMASPKALSRGGSAQGPFGGSAAARSSSLKGSAADSPALVHPSVTARNRQDDLGTPPSNPFQPAPSTAPSAKASSSSQGIPMQSVALVAAAHPAADVLRADPAQPAADAPVDDVNVQGQALAVLVDGVSAAANCEQATCAGDVTGTTELAIPPGGTSAEVLQETAAGGSGNGVDADQPHITGAAATGGGRQHQAASAEASEAALSSLVARVAVAAAEDGQQLADSSRETAEAACSSAAGQVAGAAADLQEPVVAVSTSGSDHSVSQHEPTELEASTGTHDQQEDETGVKGEASYPASSAPTGAEDCSGPAAKGQAAGTATTGNLQAIENAGEVSTIPAEGAPEGLVPLDVAQSGFAAVSARAAAFAADNGLGAAADVSKPPQQEVDAAGAPVRHTATGGIPNGPLNTDGAQGRPLDTDGAQGGPSATGGAQSGSVSEAVAAERTIISPNSPANPDSSAAPAPVAQVAAQPSSSQSAAKLGSSDTAAAIAVAVSRTGPDDVAACSDAASATVIGKPLSRSQSKAEAKGALAAVSRVKSGGALSRSSSANARSEWLLFNDFCVMPAPLEEALDLFGGQKIPCLMLYTQVQPEPLPPALQLPLLPSQPCISHAGFLDVCNLPPLQPPRVLLAPRSFVPFGAKDELQAGYLLGLDAEFVQLEAPIQQSIKDSSAIDVAPPASRLCVARISIVRGPGGHLEGTPAIDDYIRMVEPVADYLTKFSGLVSGDLELQSSSHYLTTLKASYTKLQYLIDSGCVFVGHGLQNDFRLINLVVPPDQVVDTVELFHLKQQRYLSLRFLAARLLGAHIQTDSHDSIEDAKTALKLYQVYQDLVQQGTFQETLLELYQHGNMHGWDTKAKA